MPKNPPRHRSRWLIALALILLSLIPFAFQHAKKSKDSQSSSFQKRTSAQSSIISKDTQSARSKRSLTPTLPPSHKVEDLENFLIPPFELKEITLQESLDTLFAHYREICFESGEHPISFKYKIHGNPESIVFLKLKGNFLANCKLIAAMAGTSLEVKDSHMVLSEIDDGPETTKKWTVPPTFMDWVGVHYSSAEPFNGKGIQPRISMTGMLKKLGMIKGKESGSYLSSSSTFIARGGNKSQNRMNEIIKTIAFEIPLQTKIHFPSKKSQEGPSTVLIPGQLFNIQHPSQGSQSIVRSTEQGFGRQIQTVSFTGESPSNEARDLYLETGNVSDLGISENLSYATFNITRDSEGDLQNFTYKDEHGTLHEQPFTTQRIDATGRIIPLPQ